MRSMGLAGIAPGPNTSQRHPEHKMYPYLLRGMAITRPNQVWTTDITYVRLPRGFVYNAKRPHQSLDNQTPDEVYRNGQGGGATIPDHFKDQSVETGREKTGQRCTAVEQAETLT